MKISIDVQTTLGQPTGFGFYVSSLVDALQKISQEDELVLIRPEAEKDFSTPQRFVWDQFSYPARARRAKVDLLHQPCFSAPLFFSGPVVITIHDIISILFPENIPFASRMFYSKWMPLTYGKASEIITISQSTANDITRVLKIPPEKITVIHSAVDEKFEKPTSADEVEKAKKKYNLPKDYLLHIGTLEPRKNLGFLIEAFARVISDEKNENLNLVITGKKGWYFEGLFEKVRQLNLEKRVIFTGYIDELDKPAIYKGAKIFTFPSLYEGFGLPPLEAMASGVPIISSNTSSMPEVIGEAGVLISPHDLASWVRAISKLNTDEVARRELIEKNKIQIKKFSWEKTARQTMAVYHKTAEKFNKM
jgi:glycosyltransferase involved in cell wall biosynthesis